MTINKSQDQSLESLRLYLPRRIFSHIQLLRMSSDVKIMLGKNIGNIIYSPPMSSFHPNLYRLSNLSKENSVHLYLFYDNQ
ncbi:hypothetical protein Lal_00012754 [Lupinus albus]|nr:hypothetical protein Lal_00012754 [Lupinus albus]